MSQVFGSKVRRREDPRYIQGYGHFTEDIVVPRLAHAVFLRSPYAHAKIKSIQTEKAGAQPGVIAVFTGKDTGLGAVPTAWPITNADIKIPKYYPLAVDRVRYSGDPVAVLVAQSWGEALDAIEKIEVEYEQLPVVVDAEKAMQPGAPQLYDEVPNNIAFDWKAGGGDIEKAFQEAEVTIKERFVNQRLQPSTIETRGATADYDPGTGQLTMWITSQNPHVHRFLISAITGVPENKLRVIATDVGGGFGSKLPVYGPEFVIAWLAKKLETPVRWIEDRRENYLSTDHGRDHVDYVELAAKKDGTVLGIRVHTIANMGAWLSTAGPGVPTILFGLILSGPYKIPSISCRVQGVLTNTMAVDTYRGAGRPEATFIIERLMDLLAREVKMDPAEVRMKNFIPPDAFPYTAPTGIIYDSGNYAPAMQKALEMVGYAEFRKEQEKLRAEGKLVGIGISSYVEICGLGPSAVVRSTGFGLGLWESATVRVHPGGKISAFTGSSPHGQSEETTFAQIVAEEFGVKYEDVEVIHGDTDQIPFGMGTYGSRATPVGGAAIAVSSRKVIEKAKKIAAHLMEAREEDVILEEGKFHVKGSKEPSKSLSEVAYAAYGAGANEIPRGMEPGLENTTFYDPPNFVFPFGTHICIAEVSKDTGEVKIKKYVAVDDCGKQINPMIVEGQIHGGITQGIAQALWEESVYDADGNLITGTLVDYAVPTAVETPHYDTSHTETPSPHNPIGVKGIGEAGTIAAAPAVVNAVVDALSHMGVTHIDMPLRSDKIWGVLNTKG
ncbi:MAG: molybdopterin-dependent oxidoreductase [Thaumarchaeota archaeon]|nr:molybdopterin-dependent oxidoreductase [Nitrososphaerota archaeon]